MPSKQTKEISQTELKALLLKVSKKYLEDYPNEKLVSNSNPANYAGLTNVINEYIGRPYLIKPEWLRTLFYTKQNKVSSRLKCEYFNALHEYIGENKPVNEDGNSLLDGEYFFIYRGTKHGDSITAKLYEHKLIIKNSMVWLEVDDTIYISNRIRTLKSPVVYVELISKSANEMVYLAFHIGIAGKEDLDYISGLFLSVDNSPLPTSGPFLLINNQVKINTKTIYSYFRNFSITTLKSISINDLQKLIDKDLFASTAMSDYEVRREGLIGKWTVLNISKDRTKIEVAHLFVEMYSIRFESANNYYTEGEIKIIGDRNLVISMYNSGRHATVIANLHHYRKTHQIKYLASSYSATGSIRPIYGFSLLVRTSILENDLEVGDYSFERVFEAGVSKDYLIHISKDTAGVIPQIKLI